MVVVWTAGVPAMREWPYWHLAFLSNGLFDRLGEWKDGLAHFWTLAVEEQFYVVWPIVILFAPRPALRCLVAALAVASGLLRWWLASSDPFGYGILMPTRLDALALAEASAVAPLR